MRKLVPCNPFNSRIPIQQKKQEFLTKRKERDEKGKEEDDGYWLTRPKKHPRTIVRQVFPWVPIKEFVCV